MEHRQDNSVVDVTVPVRQRRVQVWDETMRHRDSPSKLLPPWRCKVCGKRFTTETRRDDHSVEHGPEQFPCPVCGTTFLHETARFIHIQEAHAGRRLFRCETCGEKLECCCLLQVHAMRHSQPLTCPQCGAQQPSRRTYNEHVDEHMGLVPGRRAVQLLGHLFRVRARDGQPDKGPAPAAAQPRARTVMEAERCALPQSSSRAPTRSAYLPASSAVRTRSIPAGLNPGADDEATRDGVRSEKDVDTVKKNDSFGGVENRGKGA